MCVVALFCYVLLQLGAELFRAPELLFDPSLIGLEYPGVHEVLNNAIMNEARNYPGQERQVLDFYRQNPNAAAQMRAPIYEEKVCDLIFDTAKVTDTPITKEELLKEDDDL